jgi:uncharacterized membrane protein
MRMQNVLAEREVAHSRLPLKTVKKWIQQGWMTGLICGFITLLCSVLGASGYPIYDFGLLNLIDVFLILVMTFGIYKKSRVAATSMFVYYIGSIMLTFIDYGPGTVGMVSLIFAYLYFQAMRGTFIYKRTIEDLKAQALVEKEYTSAVVYS